MSRLWSSNEAEEVDYGDQVIVATIAKLDSGVMEKSSYTWLSRAHCIVVDEAHTSITTAYTALLNWQGMERNKDRAPLIGLTATPYRGTNEVETQRLVARYGGRRLDLDALGGADAYPHLQEMGILSKVKHELLPGSDIELTVDELRELTERRQLPDAAVKRLAVDAERNRTLLESVGSLYDKSWSVLLFAVSVEHAAAMAALLSREGISAAAISSETNHGQRRFYIEQFRRELLRVLTNFNVLAAGFDAPPGAGRIRRTADLLTQRLSADDRARSARPPKRWGQRNAYSSTLKTTFCSSANSLPSTSSNTSGILRPQRRLDSRAQLVSRLSLTPTGSHVLLTDRQSEIVRPTSRTQPARARRGGHRARHWCWLNASLT